MGGRGVAPGADLTDDDDDDNDAAAAANEVGMGGGCIGTPTG
jgi:hypothetical protein